MRKFFIKILNYFNIFVSKTDWKKKFINRVDRDKKNISLDEIYKKLYSQKLLDKTIELIVFDVGANIGQSIDRFRQNHKKLKLHCFEPNKEAFVKLKKYQSSNIYINNFALGEKNSTKEFYNYPKTSSSSFFEINKKSSIYEINKEYKKQHVEIKTLDEYLKDNNINKINILKIDTQGFEVEVLKGAYNSIKNKRIDLIETEVNLGFQYKNQTTFKQIEDQLYDNYLLIAIKEHGNSISNYDFQTNVVYVSKDFLDHNNI